MRRMIAAVPLVLAATFVSLPARADSAAEINANVQAALTTFRSSVGEAPGLLKRAKGVLVFPRVLKAGLVFGGEYGEGALRTGGRTKAYYSLASASFGLQIGGQTRTVIILFMTNQALANFRSSQGWEVGVDGSVAIVTVGAGGTIDSNNLQASTLGFILNPKGLMVNLSLEGSKISRIRR